MKFARFSLVLGVACIGLTVVAAPVQKHKPNLIREWQARYNMGAKLFTAKDTNALSTNLTDDWEMTGPDNRVISHKSDMDKLKAQLDTMRDFHAKFHVLHVNQEGDHAVIRAHFDFAGKMKGQDGKWHRVRQTGVNEETWVKQGDDWRMRKLHTIQEKYTRDGKAMRPPAM